MKIIRRSNYKPDYRGKDNEEIVKKLKDHFAESVNEFKKDSVILDKEKDKKSIFSKLFGKK